MSEATQAVPESAIAPGGFIVDCDTGTDDAIALLLAVNTMGDKLRAVTCVDGNVGLDDVVRNTLALLDAVGADVPVGKGCSMPLAASTVDAGWVHGEKGLGDVMLPPPRRQAVDALDLLRDTLEQSDERLTIVALAPLTNLALLFTAYPHLKEKVARVVVMGGSAAAGGNDVPAAEFNFFHDPEAADIVFRSGVEMWMYGLDVYGSVTVGPEWIERLRSVGTPPAVIAADVLLSRIRMRGTPTTTLGDAGTLAVALWPDLAVRSTHPVAIELQGRFTRGMSVVDRRRREQIAPHNDKHGWSPTEVIWSIDANKMRDRVFTALAGAPGS